MGSDAEIDGPRKLLRRRHSSASLDEAKRWELTRKDGKRLITIEELPRFDVNTRTGYRKLPSITTSSYLVI